VRFAGLLDRWLDPATTFAMAFEPAVPSALTGLARWKRGIGDGCPDNWSVHQGKIISIDLNRGAGSAVGRSD
jgi:hypothetical protein